MRQLLLDGQTHHKVYDIWKEARGHAHKFSNIYCKSFGCKYQWLLHDMVTYEHAVKLVHGGGGSLLTLHTFDIYGHSLAKYAKLGTLWLSILLSSRIFRTQRRSRFNMSQQTLVSPWHCILQRRPSNKTIELHNAAKAFFHIRDE